MRAVGVVRPVLDPLLLLRFLLLEFQQLLRETDNEGTETSVPRKLSSARGYRC